MYRRILKKYYDSNDEAMPVNILAFRPTEIDGNGISVVRKKYSITPSDALVGVDPAKYHLYHLAELPVTIFVDLGLTVVEAKRDNCIGHACVVELNTTSNNDKTKKAELKDKMRLLALEAGKRMILLPVVTDQ